MIRYRSRSIESQGGRGGDAGALVRDARRHMRAPNKIISFLPDSIFESDSESKLDSKDTPA